MNGAYTQSSLLGLADQQRADYSHLPDTATDNWDFTAQLRTKLTSEDIRRLYAEAPSAQTQALTIEVYRLRALIRRAADFLGRAGGRLDNTLDITSRTLLRGLNAALKEEPALLEQQASAGAHHRVAYRRHAFAPVSPPAAPVRIDAPLPRSGKGGANKADTQSRERLHTWRLFPERGRGGEAWKGSRYRGLVIVRAHDPVEARRLAAEAFASEPRMAGPVNTPWSRRSLVRVELVSDDATYDKISKPAIVYP